MCYLQVLHSPMGREPGGQLGEQILLHLLHRSVDGADVTGPRPAASHPHAGQFSRNPSHFTLSSVSVYCSEPLTPFILFFFFLFQFLEGN